MDYDLWLERPYRFAYEQDEINEEQEDRNMEMAIDDYMDRERGI